MKKRHVKGLSLGKRSITKFNSIRISGGATGSFTGFTCKYTNHHYHTCNLSCQPPYRICPNTVVVCDH